MILRDTNIDVALAARRRSRDLVEGPRVCEFLMNPYRFGGGGGSGPADPLYANVALLINGDGVSGDSTIKDDSSYNASPSVQTAGIVYSGLRAQVGPTSILFPFGGASSKTLKYSGTRFLIPANTEWCIEGWFYFDGTNASLGGTLFNIADTEGPGRIVLYVNSLGSVLMNKHGSSDQGFVNGFGWSTWNHVAWTRRLIGGSYRIGVALNGSYAGATYVEPGAFGTGGGGLAIAEGQQQLPAFLQLVRMTVGDARYASDFTPPSAYFGTHA